MLFRLPHLGLDWEWWRTVSKAAAAHCESWRFSLFPSVPAEGSCCNCSGAAPDPACSQCSFPYCASFAQHHNSDSSFLWWWRLLIFLLLKKQSLNFIRLGVSIFVVSLVYHWKPELWDSSYLLYRLWVSRHYFFIIFFPLKAMNCF